MYPQAKASDTVLAGQDFFRLYTQLESIGDIYRIDTSVLGLAIGPLSDIQTVRLYHYDPRVNSFVNQIAVSVSDPFVGRLDARLDQDYPGLGTKGKILVRADDFVPSPDQVLVIDASNPAQGELVVWHRPWIDLIAYHAEPASLPIARSEKHWFEQCVITTHEIEGSSYYLYPHYRRKYFHARMFNTLDASVDFTIYGLTFLPNVTVDAGSWTPLPMIRNLTTGTVLSVDTQHPVLYSEKIRELTLYDSELYPIGYFDYMCVRLTGAPFDYDPAHPGKGFVMDVVSSDWAV